MYIDTVNLELTNSWIILKFQLTLTALENLEIEGFGF